MSFFSSLFSKEERQKKVFEKNLKLVVDKNKQNDERYRAMQYLKDLGSDEAIYGILRRFTIVAAGKGGTVVDEEEKQWAFKTILNFGERALPSLEKFVLSKEGPAVNPVHSISQALELIKTIKGNDKTYMKNLIKKLVADNPPGYERDPVRKEEILNFILDWDDSDMIDFVVEYLDDMNETIRFLTVECLFKYDNKEEIAREPLLKLFKEEESLRIRNRIIQGFADKNWSIKGFKSYIEQHLDKAKYNIIKGDRIVPKKGAKK